MKRKQLDVYSMFIVSKYVETIEDLKRIQQVNTKFQDIMERFHYNPVQITSKQRKYFQRLQTLYVYSRDDPLFFNGQIQKIRYCYPVPYEEYHRKVEHWTTYSHVYYSNRDVRLCGYRIPSMIKELDDRCFVDYNFLNLHLTIPTTITRIGERCFDNCYGLEEIELPSSIKSIGYQCFYDCCELKKIIIPSSVSYLGADCFSNCSNLTSITFESSIDRLGQNIFWDCHNLKELNVKFLLTYTEKVLLFGDTVINNIVIPTSVDFINRLEFKPSKKLISFTIPSNVTGLGSYCFTDCTTITRLQISHSLSWFGRKCFFRCDQMQIDYKFDLPNYVFE